MNEKTLKREKRVEKKIVNCQFYAIYYFIKKVALTSITAFHGLQWISTRTNIKYISENKKKEDYVHMCINLL